LGKGGIANMFVVVEEASFIKDKGARMLDFVFKVEVDGWFYL